MRRSLLAEGAGALLASMREGRAEGADRSTVAVPDDVAVEVDRAAF